MQAEEQNIIEASRVAEDNRDRTIACKEAIQGNFVVLARLFKDSRDNSLWKLLDYDSFEAYVGSPEIGFSRSKVYNLIHLYELFVEKLGMSPDEVMLIDQSKLALIAPVVESDREGWLSKARHLSKSDLQIELGQGPGVNQNLSSPPPSAPANLNRLKPGDYLNLVRESCCGACGGRPAEAAHFPRTKGAGALYYHVIPLCRKCHTEYHQDPAKWTWANRKNWSEWMYGLIVGE